MFQRASRRSAIAWLPYLSGGNLPTCGLIIAFLAAAGCDGSNKKVAHLQGVVTIGGRPLPADALANISIRPTAAGQGRAAGAKVAGGKYDCRDAPLGKVKVYVDVQAPNGKMIPGAGGITYPELQSIIAPKYGEGIDLEITGDNANQNFDLESSEGHPTD